MTKNQFVGVTLVICMLLGGILTLNLEEDKIRDLPEPEYCVAKYGDRPINSVPAWCAKYFN